MKPVVLIGQMGVGKTTIGRMLAERLGRSFIDSDLQILELTGLTGRDIAAQDGVVALHDLELQALLAALRSGDEAVIAAAASVVDDPRGREALREPFCIWIDREPAAPAPGSHRRHVAPGEHLVRRRRVFEGLADITLAGDDGPEEYTSRAIEQLPPEAR